MTTPEWTPELVEALRPFAKAMDDLEGIASKKINKTLNDEMPIFQAWSSEFPARLSLGDLRRARAALRKALGETDHG